MNKQINKQNFFRINGVLTKNMGNTMWSSRFYSSNLTNNIGDLFIGPSRRSKKMWSRDHIILSSWIGSKVKVYNGRQVFSILITSEMCGYKLGEFVYTRSEQRTKKKKSKKK